MADTPAPAIMATATSSLLSIEQQRLWRTFQKACAPLHVGGSLSLEQLVSVHEAMLRVLLTDNTDDHDAGDDNVALLTRVTSWTVLEQQFLHDGATTTSSTTAAQKVMTVQFLLKLSPNAPPPDLLVLLSRLVVHDDDDANEGSIDAMEKSSFSKVMGHLVVSYLDDAVIPTFVEHLSVVDFATLPLSHQAYLLQQLQARQSDQRQLYRPVATALIKRGLHQLVQHVLQTLRDEIPAMKMRQVLAPVTNMLVPLVQDDACSLQTLWSVLWEFWLAVPPEIGTKQDRVQTTHLLLIITSIATVLLPFSLQNTTASDGNADKTDAMRTKPQVTLLWPLLKRCLGQNVRLGKRVTWVHESWKSQPPRIDAFVSDDAASSELIRRRALYMMRSWTVYALNKEEEHRKTTTLGGQHVVLVERCRRWSSYAACYETIEMEKEPHLLDQIWTAVADLCSHGASVSVDQCDLADDNGVPDIDWSWLELLLSRAISSPAFPIARKHVMYRFLSGQAGVTVTLSIDNDATSSAWPVAPKRNTRNTKAQLGSTVGAPLSMLTPQFVVYSLIFAFDSLEASVGTMVHSEEPNGKLSRHDLVAMMHTFIHDYVLTLFERPERLQDLIGIMWSAPVMCLLNRKVAVGLFEAVGESIMSASPGATVYVTNNSLSLLVDTFGMYYSLGLSANVYRRALLRSVAITLSKSQVDSARPSPETILDIVSLFVPLVGFGAGPAAIDVSERLQQWLIHLTTPFAVATIGTAFVDGLLGTSTPTESVLGVLPSKRERQFAQAIALCCRLEQANNNDCSGSSALWNAISKGLAYVQSSLVSPHATKAAHASRAILLLRYGCEMQIISGMGNGGLLVDRSSQHMMPPPPSIEKLLADAMQYLLHRLDQLLSPREMPSDSRATRADNDHKVLVDGLSASLADLESLSVGFPSSSVISNAVNDLKERAIGIMDLKRDGTLTQGIALLFTSLSCGAELQNEALPLAKKLAAYVDELSSSGHDSSVESANARSVRIYSTWGAISRLVPQVTSANANASEVTFFLAKLGRLACAAVEATPANALSALFRCIVATATLQHALGDFDTVDINSSRYLEQTVRALCTLMDETKSGHESMAMLDEICCLLFTSDLMAAEELQLQADGSAPSPIRDAFRHLIKSAGRKRPHILQAVLCHFTSACLSSEGAVGQGVIAIPYVEDIVALVEHKGEAVEASGTSQSCEKIKDSGVNIPDGTHVLSIGRAFMLEFISRLPDIGDNLDQRVQSDLLTPIILSLIDHIRPLSEGMVMFGTAPYCLKMRGWQALCVLNRFVTVDIAQQLWSSVYEALEEPLHGYIRYFIEVFAIQCCRRFPEVFGAELVRQMGRTNLPLQMIASLMIVAGNLVVGRYSLDFFRGADCAGRRHQLLTATIPWLGSTQGFSRAIAQLLVHKLIPLVQNTDELNDEGQDGWYLRSIFNFLDSNVEMKRMRKKQVKFFEGYDADRTCTPAGVLEMAVDEGGEAAPAHMVDIMKQCLAEVFEEAHDASELPTWRQIDVIIATQREQDGAPVADASDTFNIQRKIVPLDSLNIAFENEKERRSRNLAGRRKQDIIVCASLIDKVPNLGGLARTSEIFAVRKLVVPDLQVAKMDNFQQLSVGAGDWIDMEACNEASLARWLSTHKELGYYIVGVEQTSSSSSLDTYTFPTGQPIVLLLGKEKEGIPVEFLALVDQCVEIPQLGIIRSLNVHVSAAIAIWEFSKQRMSTAQP